ncbi:unnamed protein product, partial [Lasius platythorax]
MDTDIHVP